MSNGYQQQRSADGAGPQGQRVPEAAPRQRESRLLRGCAVAAIVVVALGILGLVGLVVLVGLGTAMAGPVAEEGVRLEEETVGGRPGAPKVVCIPIEGMIYGATVPGRELTPVALVVAQLRRAARDPKVCGAILYVDSPGGAITGSDILHREVHRFRQAHGRRYVTACMMDIAASGAYYVSVAADRIIAHPTTVTGSIGVMMPLYDATGLMDKVGVTSESLATGEYKDIGSPFVKKDQEQKRREREILRGIIDEMYDQFVSVVAAGRKLEAARVRSLADGRIFTSKQALQHGLIDQIGYESDAVDALKELAGVSEVHLVRYRRAISLSDILMVFARGPRLSLDVDGALPKLDASRPMFLWQPPPAGAQDALSP